MAAALVCSRKICMSSPNRLIVVQAAINVAAYLGYIVGPMSIGAFTRADPVNGWRKFYVRCCCPSFSLYITFVN